MGRYKPYRARPPLRRTPHQHELQPLLTATVRTINSVPLDLVANGVPLAEAEQLVSECGFHHFYQETGARYVFSFECPGGALFASTVDTRCGRTGYHVSVHMAGGADGRSRRSKHHLTRYFLRRRHEGGWPPMERRQAWENEVAEAEGFVDTKQLRNQKIFTVRLDPAFRVGRELVYMGQDVPEVAPLPSTDSPRPRWPAS